MLLLGLLLGIAPQFISCDLEEIVSTLNHEVDPCEDFYTHVCVPPPKKTPAKASDASGSGSSPPQDELYENVKFLDQCLKHTRPEDKESGTWKVKHFYQQCVKDADEAVNQENYGKIISVLNKTISYSDGYDFTNIIVELARVTGDLGWISIDNVDSDEDYDYLVYGLHLIFEPNCTKDCDEWRMANAKFILRHLERLGGGLFSTDTAELAFRVLDLNEKLSIEIDEEELDFLIVPIEKLQEVIPLANWDTVFERVPFLSDLYTYAYNVTYSVTYFERLTSVIEAEDEDVVKAYLLMKYVGFLDIVIPTSEYDSYREYWKLNDHPDAEFETKTLFCLNYTGDYFGGQETLFRIFLDYSVAKDYLSGSAEFATKINESIHALVPRLPWLSNSAKASVVDRVANISFSIGDHKAFVEGESVEDLLNQIDIKEEDNVWDLQVKTTQLNGQYSMENKGYLKDKTRLFLANAYYERARNRISVTPLLLPVVYDPQATELENYAKLGFTIGHEIGHGVSAAIKNALKNSRASRWWYEQFISGCLIDLYDSFYVPDAKQYVNGTLSLEENIADMFGVHLAYEAFQRSNQSTKQLFMTGKRNYTNDKLFFYAYAHGVCETKPESGHPHFDSFDVHSPTMARINLPLANYVPFAKAFQCSAKTPMVSRPKCRIFEDALSPYLSLATIVGIFCVVLLVVLIVVYRCCCSKPTAKTGSSKVGYNLVSYEK